MSVHLDRWNPRYIDNLAVSASQTVVGGNVLLDGGAAVAVEVDCTNGAAGSVTVEATNQRGMAVTTYVAAITQPITANGSGFFTFSLNDQLTGFAQFRVRFVSTAAGNVTISTNVRRLYS